MPISMQDAMAERVLIADGARGTMLQDAKPTLDDYQGYEGCQYRPDLLAGFLAQTGLTLDPDPP